MSLIFLALMLPAFSQQNEKDTAFNCIAYWKKGEEKVLLIARHKQNYRSGKPGTDFDFSYEASVTVLDSLKDGYKMQWVFHLPDELKQANPGIAELMPVYEGLKMVFTISTLGTFKELINWEEVRNAYVKMAEVSIPKNREEEAKKVMDKAKEMFSTKEVVESALIREIILYHVLYGGSFTKNGRIEETSLPGPFSADSIPAVVSSKITEILPLTNDVTILAEQKIDIANAGRIFEGIFRKMGLPEDSVMTKAKELLTEFEMNDRSEYTINRSTGWVKKIDYQRIARTKELESKDSFIITMKE